MNTKLASFIVLLALAITSCVAPPVSAGTGVATKYINSPSSLTETTSIEPSPLPTFTPPPTETPTPLPMPSSTPLISVARVVYNGVANIREGACNQPVLTTATRGMEFPVTGRFTTPSGEVWWRIQLSNGAHGWIWGDLVEVTHAALVPFVDSHCPPFPTDTPTATNTPELPVCQRRTLTTNRDWTEMFWPTHTRGDREFAGNGPYVEVATYIYVYDHELQLMISMWAAETVSDFTTATGNMGPVTVFRVPDGWRIQKVNLNNFRDTAGAYYSEWSYMDDDTDLDSYTPQDGGPVDRFEVMGDTAGDDFGAWPGTAGTSFVRVKFRVFEIELIQEGNCRA